MEGPVIHRIVSDFDKSLLTDPSNILSHALAIVQPFTFWKLGALLFAFIATFTSLLTRLRFFILSFRKYIHPISEPVLRHSDQYEVSTDDDEDDDASLSYSSDDDDDDVSSSYSSEDYEDDRVAGGHKKLDENQWQNGKFKLSRRHDSIIGHRFSWSDFASGKSVVKLWDGLGVGLDLNHSSGSVLSIYDLNRDQKLNSIFRAMCQIPAISASSPENILTAGVENFRQVALRVWDPRAGCQIPAMLAEWMSNSDSTVDVKFNGHEVYVRDDVSGELTVRDMRNVNVPLENVTECDGDDTWWDADAVLVSKDCESDETSAVYNRDAIESRCRDAFYA